MRATTFAVCVTFILATISASAEEAPKVAGIFSSLGYNKEGGDLLGLELVIVPVRGGYTAFVEFAEGELHPPVIVPLTVKATEVTFAIPPDCTCGLPAGQYSGTVTSAGLALRGPHEPMSDRSPQFVLVRGKSYWQ
jgi:hypothetical protein